MYKYTYERSNEEYNLLNKEDKKLYNLIEESDSIYSLMNTDLEDDNVIVNFKTTQDSNRTYFKFDIANASEPANNPQLTKTIKGSFLDCGNEKSIIYNVDSLPKSHIKPKTYIDKITTIKENVILHESFEMLTYLAHIEPAFVKLVVKNHPSSPDEVFMIDPENEIYKLYSRKKMDLITLCNMIFFQANENEKIETIENTDTEITKVFTKTLY